MSIPLFPATRTNVAGIIFNLGDEVIARETAIECIQRDNQDGRKCLYLHGSHCDETVRSMICQRFGEGRQVEFMNTAELRDLGPWKFAQRVRAEGYGSVIVDQLAQMPVAYFPPAEDDECSEDRKKQNSGKPKATGLKEWLQIFRNLSIEPDGKGPRFYALAPLGNNTDGSFINFPVKVCGLLHWEQSFDYWVHLTHGVDGVTFTWGTRDKIYTPIEHAGEPATQSSAHQGWKEDSLERKTTGLRVVEMFDLEGNQVLRALPEAEAKKIIKPRRGKSGNRKGPSPQVKRWARENQMLLRRDDDSGPALQRRQEMLGQKAKVKVHLWMEGR